MQRRLQSAAAFFQACGWKIQAKACFGLSAPASTFSETEYEIGYGISYVGDPAPDYKYYDLMLQWILQGAQQ